MSFVRLRAVAALLCLATFAPAVFAQTATGGASSVAQALAGNADVPLTIKVKDMTGGGWRKMYVNSAFSGGGAAGALTAFSPYAALMNGGVDPSYFTQGRTVTIGGKEFLVTYRQTAKQIDFSALQGANPPKSEPLTAETELALSLLSVEAIQSFDNVRPFDFQQESVKKAEEERQNRGEESKQRLKQLGLAMLMYVQDYDERLPYTKDPSATKRLLLPYAKNENVFVVPGSSTPYQTNPSLSRRSLAEIEAPATMVAFYEPQPLEDGTRGVAFLDGHVKRIREEDWPKVARESGIVSTPSGAGK